MKFGDFKGKCPWTSLSMNMLEMCSVNGKVCKKENCGILYWISKLKCGENNDN